MGGNGDRRRGAPYVAVRWREGADLATYDGAELGEAIAANPGDIEAALLAYEKDLFPRSASTAAEADRNLKLCFDDDAPQSLLNLFNSLNSATSCAGSESTPISMTGSPSRRKL